MTDQEKLEFFENMLINHRIPITELIKIINFNDGDFKNDNKIEC